ncbi:hypothetical protein NGB28_05025 [Staphylococcus xylosus]|uniref:hypothetical protein n=1 Tax=Staphylococcus xylosus TaxID=1288 RepID=UPI002DBC6ABF|nr:hypothetical protein [Staphylococcus xylosus]MEB7659563.1 hypothetical protein [Staphylococcus xylosus]MEB7709491.1 hypothetical protein [Staphylococcus xylosus]MEB7785290.1 hypothetical protein [Staphylococcus xylosus]
MIINKKKYEKLNNDLVDVKVKAFNDVKKALDGENKVMRLCLQIKEQRDQYKSERDTLIDDIAVLKANISRLERENRDLKHENKALRLQSNTYFDEWQSVKKQYSTLTNHIRLKAEMNPSVDRYIELKNFIMRLEKGE